MNQPGGGGDSGGSYGGGEDLMMHGPHEQTENDAWKKNSNQKVPSDDGVEGANNAHLCMYACVPVITTSNLTVTFFKAVGLNGHFRTEDDLTVIFCGWIETRPRNSEVHFAVP